MINLALDEIHRKIFSIKLEKLLMKEDILKSRGGNHISGGSTIQKDGLKHIYDELTKDLEESPIKESKFGYLQSILELLGETYDKDLDISSGSTITCWSLFKILRSLE